jgi:hypothetical protein
VSVDCELGPLRGLFGGGAAAVPVAEAVRAAVGRAVREVPAMHPTSVHDFFAHGLASAVALPAP